KGGARRRRGSPGRRHHRRRSGPLMLRRLAPEPGPRLGLLRLVRLGRHRPLSVLTYHGFVDHARRARGRYAYLYRNCLSVSRLEEHLAFLRRAYHILNPDEALALLEGGGATGERSPRVVITIDDAGRSVCDLALPVLCPFGVHSVLLAPTEGVAHAAAARPWCQWHERLAMLLLSDPAGGGRTWETLRQYLPHLPPEPRRYTNAFLARLELHAGSLLPPGRHAMLQRL